MERRSLNFILLTAILHLAMLFTTTAQQTNPGDVVKNYKDKEVTKRIKLLETKEPVIEIERNNLIISGTPIVISPDSLQSATFNEPTEMVTTTEVRLSAQEIEQEFPECVITDYKGDKHIDYMSMVSVLFEAIREQNKKIEELEKKNKELEEKLNK